MHTSQASSLLCVSTSRNAAGMRPGWLHFCVNPDLLPCEQPRKLMQLVAAHLALTSPHSPLPHTESQCTTSQRGFSAAVRWWPWPVMSCTVQPAPLSKFLHALRAMMRQVRRLGGRAVATQASCTALMCGSSSAIGPSNQQSINQLCSRSMYRQCGTPTSTPLGPNPLIQCRVQSAHPSCPFKTGCCKYRPGSAAAAESYAPPCKRLVWRSWRVQRGCLGGVCLWSGALPAPRLLAAAPASPQNPCCGAGRHQSEWWEPGRAARLIGETEIRAGARASWSTCSNRGRRRKTRCFAATNDR